MKQNGATEAHERVWPLYQREAFRVEVTGAIDAKDFENAELLQRELHGLLSGYGLVVTVASVLVLETDPKDQAEKEALDHVAVV